MNANEIKQLVAISNCILWISLSHIRFILAILLSL